MLLTHNRAFNRTNRDVFRLIRGQVVTSKPINFPSLSLMGTTSSKVSSDVCSFCGSSPVRSRDRFVMTSSGVKCAGAGRTDEHLQKHSKNDAIFGSALNCGRRITETLQGGRWGHLRQGKSRNCCERGAMAINRRSRG